jgi:hypothetical protein
VPQTHGDVSAPVRTSVYMSGVRNIRRFLDWIRENFASSLVDQVKGKLTMLVPKTADVFGAAVGALLFLDGGKGVSFHSLFPPGGPMRSSVVDKLNEAYIPSSYWRGSGSLAHRCAGRNATPVEGSVGTRTPRRTVP